MFISISTPVQAEYFRQWIAPPECVTDAGLETQVILSEKECYDLINPPLKEGDSIEIPPDSLNHPYSVPAQPKQTTAYPSMADDIAPLTLRDIQSNTSPVSTSVIRVDIPDYQPYDGMARIVVLMIVYILLLSFLLYRNIRGEKV